MIPPAASILATRGVESDAMRSWVFRHRLRLRVIYGPRPEPVRPIESEPFAERSAQGLKPGEWMRRKDAFILRPMTPPAA